jgi:hypothetical protein
MKIIRLIFWSFLFSTAALIVSDQVLYRLWLVPQLVSVHPIPSYYFILVFIPMILVVLVFGLTLSSWRHICLVAFVAALSHQLHEYMNMLFAFDGYLASSTLENSYTFWFVHPFFLFCMYGAAFSLVWYSKVLLHKSSVRLASVHRIDKEAAAAINDNKTEVRMPTRVTYHVVPDPSGWLVKKGRAKKASSAHSTKEEAMRAASDIAKSHPLSQIVVHKASGVIESDRIFEYRHYKKKKKKKEISRKIKKGLKRNKRKESEQRLRRRKAAQLGIARLKRKRTLRRQAAKKGARRRKK